MTQPTGAQLITAARPRIQLDAEGINRDSWNQVRFLQDAYGVSKGRATTAVARAARQARYDLVRGASTVGQEQEHTATAGLRRWLATAGQDGGRMSHAELARQLDYSLEYVYRVMGESTPLTPSFRGRFQDVFGAAAAAAAFEVQPEPAEIVG